MASKLGLEGVFLEEELTKVEFQAGKTNLNMPGN